jgi:hypothetical protein
MKGMRCSEARTFVRYFNFILCLIFTVILSRAYITTYITSR